MPTETINPSKVKEMSLQEFEQALPLLIPADKKIALASDFDETICNMYTYDGISSTHLPVLSQELVIQAERIKSPLLIATSRSPKDEKFWQVASVLLGKRNLPVICENGSVIFFPNDVSRKTTSLLSEHQHRELNKLQAEVPNIRLNGRFANQGAEVLIRNHRMTTIDFRIQNKITKVGMPELYEDLLNFIESQYDLDGFTAVSSLNSLSIQPKNNNKLTGVEKALEALGLKRSDIF